MKQIRLAKWRIYFLLFVAFWSFAVATDFVVAEHAAGRKVWPMLLGRAIGAALLALLLYFIRKDEE